MYIASYIVAIIVIATSAHELTVHVYIVYVA